MIKTGLSELADGYDAFIVDLWGVLHDGVRAFPAAVECLRALKGAGKGTLILSNAPRRADSAAERCRELGIGRELYDEILTSGEVAWRWLAGAERVLGRRCFHLGPERDFGMRDGLDLEFVAAPALADFVLLTGLDASEDRVEDYLPLLREARDRDLVVICANPDHKVVRGGRVEFCAGALGAAYEDLGGTVHYHGKPFPEIYEACIARIGNPRRVAAIGDSLTTDVAGAAAAGIDSVFVANGLHADALEADGSRIDERKLEALFRAHGVTPTFVLPRLAW